VGRELEVVITAGQAERHAVVAGMTLEALHERQAKVFRVKPLDLGELVGRSRNPNLRDPQSCGPAIGRYALKSRTSTTIKVKAQSVASGATPRIWFPHRVTVLTGRELAHG
jgi:hypothetical protein